MRQALEYAGAHRADAGLAFTDLPAQPSSHRQALCLCGSLSTRWLPSIPSLPLLRASVLWPKEYDGSNAVPVQGLAFKRNWEVLLSPFFCFSGFVAGHVRSLTTLGPPCGEEVMWTSGPYGEPDRYPWWPMESRTDIRGSLWRART